ncbi:MAG TPA: glycosyl hydrolase family 28-related protein [Polyangiaceae bacterium]|nr:glycosyl hydrolase family 28-related protein [Polyangiaceae bacterium]
MKRSSAPYRIAIAATLFAHSAHPQSVVFAPTGTQADLQAAIEAVESPAVIVIPPGKWQVVGSINLTKDAITIIGAGMDKTRLHRDAPPPNADVATLTQYRAPFFRSKATSSVRLSSFGITSWQAASLEDREVGISFSNVSDFRVDQCSFRFTGNSGVMVGGESRGVINNCTFRDIYEASIGNYGYGDSVYGTVHTGEPYGTERATFIEDSLFEGCRHAVASNRGARYVFRHNTVKHNTVSHAIDTHGAEYPPSPKPTCNPCYDPDPDNPGTEWAIVHDNVIDDPDYSGSAITLRGGKGLVYQNTIRGYTRAIQLSKQTPQATGPIHIWDNDIIDPTQLVTGVGTCCGSGPTWELTKPSTYNPYPYPHPLTDHLVAHAGPDQRVMPPPQSKVAQVFVDASASKAKKGNIQGFGWFTSPQPSSSCSRDLLELPIGSHVVLLAVRGPTGSIEVDTFTVDVLPPGPLASSSQWNNLFFPPFPKQGTIVFDLVAHSNNLDAYVGLTGRIPVQSHGDHAMQLRLNSQGTFDVRNAEVYEALAPIPYESGKTYHIAIDFDVATRRYDVSVDGKPIATQFSFRTPQALIGQITAWHVDGSAGVEIKDLAYSGQQLGPDPACQDPVDAGVDATIPDAQLPSDAERDVAKDGVSDHAVEATTPMPNDAATPPSADSQEGCGCRVPQSHNQPYSLWLIVFGALCGCRGLRRNTHRKTDDHGWFEPTP